MENLIRNKVAESGLITLDLADYYPKEVLVLELSAFLWQGLILKEKEFRTKVADFNWAIFKNKYVCIQTPEDSILASWAFMILAEKLIPFAKDFYVGSKTAYAHKLLSDAIEGLDVEGLVDKRVIVKGCGAIEIPEGAYSQITKRLIPHVKSLMFGEACSAVPVYKRR